jgi:hypothetical protein
MKHITLEVELTEQEADDYAQFLKRVGFQEYRQNAVDDAEAYRMLDVGEKVRKILAEHGFAPR